MASLHDRRLCRGYRRHVLKCRGRDHRHGLLTTAAMVGIAAEASYNGREKNAPPPVSRSILFVRAAVVLQNAARSSWGQQPTVLPHGLFEHLREIGPVVSCNCRGADPGRDDHNDHDLISGDALHLEGDESLRAMAAARPQWRGL